MPQLTVRPADSTDRPVLERLWLMFAHDLSEFQGFLPRPDGTFRSDRVDAALDNPDWAAYLLESGEIPVGFAIVRGLGKRTRVLNSFFVVRALRRTGIGLRAVRQVIAHHPGPWEIAFQEENKAAVSFWHRVAATLAPNAWTEDRRSDPNHPDSPPDTWIAFTTPR